MIEFLEDYTTKSLPPETFKLGEQVERSAESELYFVRLGVAGYLHDGALVDQDYQPVTPRVVVEVVTTDRRFASGGGRGGEVLGLAAPQRASTGPGNAVVFGTTAPGLHQVQVDQLTYLASSLQQLDDHRTTTAEQIDQLTADLTAAQGARETALADAATANSEKGAVTTERDAALSDLADLKVQHESLQTEHQAVTDRVAELEQQLAASTGGGDTSQDGSAAKPAKAAK